MINILWMHFWKRIAKLSTREMYRPAGCLCSRSSDKVLPKCARVRGTFRSSSRRYVITLSTLNPLWRNAITRETRNNWYACVARRKVTVRWSEFGSVIKCKLAYKFVYYFNASLVQSPVSGFLSRVQCFPCRQFLNFGHMQPPFAPVAMPSTWSPVRTIDRPQRLLWKPIFPFPPLIPKWSSLITFSPRVGRNSCFFFVVLEDDSKLGGTLITDLPFLHPREHRGQLPVARRIGM